MFGKLGAVLGGGNKSQGFWGVKVFRRDCHFQRGILFELKES